jgi:hypothetical protein
MCEDAIKPTVTYYPSIATDQAYMKGFGIRQISKLIKYFLYLFI